MRTLRCRRPPPPHPLAALHAHILLHLRFLYPSCPAVLVCHRTDYTRRTPSTIAPCPLPAHNAPHISLRTVHTPLPALPPPRYPQAACQCSLTWCPRPHRAPPHRWVKHVPCMRPCFYR